MIYDPRYITIIKLQSNSKAIISNKYLKIASAFFTKIETVFKNDGLAMTKLRKNEGK